MPCRVELEQCSIPYSVHPNYISLKGWGCGLTDNYSFCALNNVLISQDQPSFDKPA